MTRRTREKLFDATGPILGFIAISFILCTISGAAGILPLAYILATLSFLSAIGLMGIAAWMAYDTLVN